MAISKDKKKQILEKVADVLKNSPTVAFVNFHGLKVTDATALRRALREKGAEYRVAKKTIAKRALSEANVPGEMPELPGELALAYGKETTPARIVSEFGKKLDGAVSIIGGIFGGKFLGKEDMTAIAEIPATPVLRGMFVNIINSPIQRFVLALGEIAKRKT